MIPINALISRLVELENIVLPRRAKPARVVPVTIGTETVNLVAAAKQPDQPSKTPAQVITADSPQMQYLNGTGDGTLSSSGALLRVASVIPNQPIALSTSYTDTDITVSWLDQSVLRPDGTSLAVPAGSISYTGLSASTQYYLYPYVRGVDGAVQFANPNPPQSSGSGTYAMQAALDGRMPLPVLKVTTSTTGGSGGSSIDPGTCPESVELVTIECKGQIQAQNVELGDSILGHCFATGKDVYRRVIAKSMVHCVAWRIVNGHRVSPCEPLWDGKAWTAAFRIPGATLDTYSGVKVNLTVESDSYNESNYWLTDGTRQLIHNAPLLGC